MSKSPSVLKMPEAKSVTPKLAQSLETKSRVLKAALKLFNERGSMNVTTHDIADETGISPGNLYYHFKNKQAIIRALFYEIEILSLEKWWKKSPANREVRFTDFMRFYFESITTHRFFFREFSSLLAHDPTLEKEWKRTYNEIFSVMREALEGWVKQGLIKPFPTVKDAEIFIETIWILSAFSHVHYEYRDRSARDKSSNEIHRVISRFLYPYHTAKGQRALELYL